MFLIFIVNILGIIPSILLNIYHSIVYNDILSKYPLKYKKGIEISNAFERILDEPGRKRSKIWVDKGSEFYSRPMKSWLEKYGI